jgi:hypothetical protein
MLLTSPTPEMDFIKIWLPAEKSDILTTEELSAKGIIVYCLTSVIVLLLLQAH